jgi:hypothetical protein
LRHAHHFAITLDESRRTVEALLSAG